MQHKSVLAHRHFNPKTGKPLVYPQKVTSSVGKGNNSVVSGSCISFDTRVFDSFSDKEPRLILLSQDSSLYQSHTFYPNQPADWFKWWWKPEHHGDEREGRRKDTICPCCYAMLLTTAICYQSISLWSCLLLLNCSRSEKITGNAGDGSNLSLFVAIKSVLYDA